LLAASILYIVGVIVVTMIGNVPMNESLDSFNTATATASEMAARRLNYEKPWNNLNTIRTIACVVAFVLTILACLVKHRIGEIKT
jgi:uncharacterized membrane protein